MAKKKKASRFPLYLTLACAMMFGFGALGIVWMRMEISKVAKHCRELEDRREIVSREVQDLRGEKSRSLRPSTLAAMVSGRLFMPTARQTMHVSEADMQRRLGSPRVVGANTPLGTQGEFAGTR
jgi:hypothetical protein